MFESSALGALEILLAIRPVFAMSSSRLERWRESSSILLNLLALVSWAMLSGLSPTYAAESPSLICMLFRPHCLTLHPSCIMMVLPMMSLSMRAGPFRTSVTETTVVSEP